MEEIFIENIIGFFKGLDWFYIVSLILLVNAFNKFYPLDRLVKIGKTKIRFSASYRVLVFGGILAVVYYYFNEGNSRQHIKILFESMLAAMALHAWIGQHILLFLKKKLKSEES